MIPYLTFLTTYGDCIMKKSKTTKSNYIPLEKLTVKCKKIGLSEQALSSILQ